MGVAEGRLLAPAPDRDEALEAVDGSRGEHTRRRRPRHSHHALPVPGLRAPLPELRAVEVDGSPVRRRVRGRMRRRLRGADGRCRAYACEREQKPAGQN